MVAAGVLTLKDAYKAVDFDTITLLLGMMIVVANLRLSGFFALANAWVLRRARRPIILLAAVVAVSGAFSAFLVNDAICLVLSPLVLELTLALRRQPTPYLLAVAMASNVGSVATITGTSLFGSPRIVELDGYEIDATPIGAMLLTQHRDGVLTQTVLTVVASALSVWYGATLARVLHARDPHSPLGFIVLGAGASIDGPALIEEAFTVVAVAPGWRGLAEDRSSGRSRSLPV